MVQPLARLRPRREFRYISIVGVVCRQVSCLLLLVALRIPKRSWLLNQPFQAKLLIDCSSSGPQEAFEAKVAEFKKNQLADMVLAFDMTTPVYIKMNS